GLGVVALGRVPDREQHDLLAVAELLDPEVPGVPAAGHEVAAGDGLLDARLVVEVASLGRAPPEVDRSRRARGRILDCSEQGEADQEDFHMSIIDTAMVYHCCGWTKTLKAPIVRPPTNCARASGIR